MKNILDEIKNIFEENRIKYFSGNESNKNIFNLPYRGIENEKNHVNIYMDVDEFQEIIKFMFIEKANKTNKSVEEIKSNLLDINSSLNFGSLSMRSDSDTIEYKVDYQLNGESFSFQQYNKFIVRCINVYELLKKDELI